MEMELKNYCIVALGSINGIKDMLLDISETKLKYLKQTGVFICTFSTHMGPNEIKEMFNKERRTFFIFEIGVESSSYKIGKKDIHDQLFGDIDNLFMLDNLTNIVNTNKSDDTLTLDEQLLIAIESEDYTKAAEIRDLLKINK